MKYIPMLIMIFFVLAFAGCSNQTAPDATTTTLLATTAATVNGEVITTDDVTFVVQSYEQQGQMIPQEDALEQLVNQRLIVQEARSQGFMLPQEQIEPAAEQQLMQMGMTLDEYKQQVEALGLSYEVQLTSFAEEMALQAYLDAVFSQLDVSVTEEEAVAFYDLYKEQSGEQMPPYEEVSAEIYALLEQQKQEDVLVGIIGQLRESAVIVYS